MIAVEDTIDVKAMVEMNRSKPSSIKWLIRIAGNMVIINTIPDFIMTL